MGQGLWRVALLALGTATAETTSGGAAHAAGKLDQIETVVVIYAENRSFDNLYGYFPGANGLQNLKPEAYEQRDRDGSVLKELPPTWGGLTAAGVVPAVGEERTLHLPNRPFAIDDPKGLNTKSDVPTRDLWHRFYQNQMQIDGGKNDKFVAYTDAGGLVMGHYTMDATTLPLWKFAKEYTLADNFYMGAFGGSFVNHQYLACACATIYPHADQSPAKDTIAVVEADGVTLKQSDASPKSALEGKPKFVNDGTLTPDFYAVNTMQPPYQPSGNKPADGGDPAYADPAKPATLPPQTATTIGDLLSAKGIAWAWYAGAWQMALDGKGNASGASFQPHHQPFNYYANLAPGTPARTQHLRDGGMNGVAFLEAIDKGTLPPVAFYKPQGNLNEHPGYTEVVAGDMHIADLLTHLQKSPQWKHMLVIVTYDENGGFWDHAAPPKADRWGPGTRIPTLLVSPLVKRGFIDHTQYDTGSILRLLTHRFDLPLLPGLAERDAALKRNGLPAMGDLTEALAGK